MSWWGCCKGHEIPPQSGSQEHDVSSAHKAHLQHSHQTGSAEGVTDTSPCYCIVWNYQCLSLSAFRCSDAAEWSPWKASIMIFIRHLKSVPSYCLPSEILVLISQIQFNLHSVLLTSLLWAHLYKKTHQNTEFQSNQTNHDSPQSSLTSSLVCCRTQVITQHTHPSVPPWSSSKVSWHCTWPYCSVSHRAMAG